MNKKEGLISAVVSILLGLLLVILKNDVISIALTVIGIGLLVSAVMDFVNHLTKVGIVKAVIGVSVLVFGWMFINLALYILAAAIIIMGLMQIVNINRYAPFGMTGKEKVIVYCKPVLTVLAGVFLFFNQGGALAWVFVVTGVLLIVEGVMDLLGTMKR